MSRVSLRCGAFTLGKEARTKRNRPCGRAAPSRRPEAPRGIVRCQLDLDPVKLVSIDDTQAFTYMAGRHRRCRRGQRLRVSIPHGHWKSATFTAGLPRTDMIAPWVLDEPMNADAFITYVTGVLVPELDSGDASSCITCRVTRHPSYAPLSRASVQRSCFSWHTAPTSIRSSWPYPS